MTERYNCDSQECLVHHLHACGIPRGVILDAFRYIPRDLFVPKEQRKHAWEDRPLPIGHGQTISQPYTVAYMLLHAEVAQRHRVLDVGSGSGYAAAILAYVTGDAKLVSSIEVKPDLASFARHNLARVGMSEVTIIEGDGKDGFSKRAPFDRIVVGAQAEEIPHPLIDQLSRDGVLIMPIGNGGDSTMTTVSQTPHGTEVSHLGSFRFVPLL